MRYVKGWPRADKIRNETIRWDLNILAINDKREDNKRKYVDRMVENRLRKNTINYRPSEREILVDLVSDDGDSKRWPPSYQNDDEMPKSNHW